MNTTTFTCTKSAEELEKSARQKSFVYKMLMWACPVFIVLSVYIFFFPQGELRLDMYMSSLFVIAACVMIYCFILFKKVVERNPSKYAQMPTKEFGWDEKAAQFLYKDKDCTLRFKGDDIEKWVSYVNNKSGESTEIILLHTGEKIILEGEWNAEVHDFLNQNRAELSLPKPKRFTLSSDIY